jgi:hypothetical protein
MRRPSSTFLIVVLVVLIAVLGFVFIAGEMRVFPSGNWMFDLIEISLFMLSTALISLGIIKGKSVYFFVTLTIVGLFLVLCSSAITVPYTVTETFSQPESGDMTPYIFAVDPPYGSPYNENGSSKIFELLPNSTRLFHWTGWEFLRGNFSIIQLNVSSTFTEDHTPLVFSIVGLTESLGPEYTVNEKYFEWGFVGFSSQNDSWWLNTWVSYYWTCPLDFSPSKDGGFLFQNPSNYTMLFRFNVIEYYQNNDAMREVTKYHTLMNPDYFYVGIVLIGSATCLEIYSRGKKQKKDRSEDKDKL